MSDPDPSAAEPEPIRPSRLVNAIQWFADRLQRHALVVLGAAVVLTIVAGVYVARNFTIDTNLETLLSQDLPFQRDSAALARAFPQLQNMLAVVVDGPSPALAREGADRLAARMAADKDHFQNVYRPGGAFFARNGLLYLEPKPLADLTDRLSEAQPLIGTLAANPTVRGLANLIGQAVGPEAAESGVELPGFDHLLIDLADTVVATDQGRYRPVGWSRLMSEEGGQDSARQFILAQPRIDTTALEPAAAAMDAVRAAAVSLGLDVAHGMRVRLTGQAALDSAQVSAATEDAGGAALLTFGLLVVLLGFGLYSIRLTIAILVVMAMSFVWSVALGVAFVGPFNLISIAFAVLFIGLSVDFSIQFCVRFNEDLAAVGHRRPAIPRALRAAGLPLTVAASAAAISFYSTVPTQYSGLASLGMVAGTSMIVALAATLIVLPALLSVVPAGSRHLARARYGLFGRLPIHRYRRLIVGLAAAAGVIAFPFALRVGFDFDPTHIQDTRNEAVQTFEEMRLSDPASLYTIDILTPNVDAAVALAKRLEGLPSVAQVLTLDSYVPEDQEANHAAIAQLAMIMPPFTLQPAPAAPVVPAEIKAALEDLRARLSEARGAPAVTAAASRLAAALDGFLARHGTDAAALTRLQDRLVGDLPLTIEALRHALEPETVTRANLPADLRARYVDPHSGQARVEVFSSLDLNQSENLIRFVGEVQSIAPHASGASVGIVEGGRAVAEAFRISTLLAFAGIFLLLLLILRHAGKVLLVLLPLSLAGVLTIATMNALGLSFNLGNIIVLPLLIGLGVAFGIYFVLRWAGGVPLETVLRTSMPDAVLLSGLATMVSFGSMALSGNPGMAILGQTLSIALFYVLACVLIVLPAMLAVAQAWGGAAPPAAARATGPGSETDLP